MPAKSPQLKAGFDYKTMPKGIPKNGVNKGWFKKGVNRFSKKCLQCGKKYEVKPYIKNTAKFCSIKCFAKFREKRIEKLCSFCCKKIIIRFFGLKNKWGNFCSRECYTKWVLREKKRIGKNSSFWKGGMPKWKCHQCGKEFLAYHRKNIPKFCSWKCSNVFHKKSAIDMNSRFQFEYKAIKELLQEGYYVARSAGSRGPFDILAINKDGLRFIQIKSTLSTRAKSNISNYVEAIKYLFTIPMNISEVIKKELWIWILRSKKWIKIDCSSWNNKSSDEMKKEILRILPKNR